MAGKRKIHKKTDLTIPKVEHRREAHERIVIVPEAVPPAVTLIQFGHSIESTRRFDFAPFYGVGIDDITYVCQRQIERFLAKQDVELEVSTVVNYARNALAAFLSYLALRSTALRRPLTLADIDRDVVDGYLQHLSDSGRALAVEA